MDLNEETQKLGGNPLFRYALLVLGLLVFFLSQSVLTWKSTSARDAGGKVEAIQFEISMLEKDIEESDSADEKKEKRDEIKALRDEKLKEVRVEAAEESVDAKSGIWFWSMVRLLGVGIMSLGLLVIAGVGSSHEKVGALIALGLLVTKM